MCVPHAVNLALLLRGRATSMPSAELVYIYTVLGLILGTGHFVATRDLIASGEFALASIGAMCAFTAILGVMTASDQN